MSCRPFDSLARCTDTNFGAGGALGSGSFERSTPAPSAASFGNGRISSSYSPSPSHSLPARCKSAVVAPLAHASCCLYASGLPPNTSLCARMSDLPPKPPMRSAPRTKRAKYCVRTRSSSSCVGPLASRRANSSSTALRTFVRLSPGFAVAVMMKRPPISRGPIDAPTSVAI